MTTTPEPAIWSMWTPCCGPFRPGGGVPYALSDSFAADHGTEQGILYRMERFYRRADGTPIPGALVVSYGFSLTTLAGREARAARCPPACLRTGACR